MSARRRHVVGPVVNRDLASSGSSRHYHDGNEASSRLLSEKTVDLDSSEQQPTTTTTTTTATTTTMTSRDRTNEFANAIRSMQSRTVARTTANLQNPRRARQIQSYSNFMMIAKNISRNITGTFIKLEKLALLAKKKSIFNDRQTEIEELTHIIKTDLKGLNLQIGKLQELGKSQRESFGSSQSHHIASHSSSIVMTLQSKLANMSNHFKSVLEVRSENMREEQSRRQQFTQGSLSTMLPPSVVSGRQGSLLLQEEISSSSVAIDLEPVMNQQLQQIIQDDTDAYMQSRAETMQNIESTIVELGGIFQQLAHMVKEQEEMVERIDSNMEDTELNVEAAHTEILRYFQSVTSNRWLMIKIFAVLIFFFIFFVVFLA
ncbi:PREDICTED: syntaxin-5 [Cyphomyrmex costatus]|uniref:Syntaxin-5 n=1 Tax=Cyphomyrmex costatus TaxID=456900 RepID=A0A151INQ1_9HYME|nr:PREDICTED: syntaxin-5 [Cyphomyrmex costatus]KYN07102.1 Syntaxin-5 [Cyphomyrmex costatus]